MTAWSDSQVKLLTAANAYVARGWPVLLLATDSARGKIPPRNCPRCDSRAITYEPHSKESCACLLCHGFHAATRDIDVVAEMLWRLPDGYLAVRTGSRSGGGSGLLVVDAEAHDRDMPGTTGLDVLDQWPSWTGGLTLPVTLTARTVSGGLHLIYRLPDGVAIRSGRVLPGVDVKGESGYVGVPCGRDGRRWVDPAVDVADLPSAVVDWLVESRRRGGGSGGSGGGGGDKGVGYDFDAFIRDGCPNGHRDVFINELVWRLRRDGWERGAAETEVRRHWERVEQPASNPMPWHDVKYKFDRVWREVAPAVTTTQTAWATRVSLNSRRAERVRRATVTDRVGPAVVRRGRSGFGLDDARGSTR